MKNMKNIKYKDCKEFLLIFAFKRRRLSFSCTSQVSDTYSLKEKVFMCLMLIS